MNLNAQRINATGRQVCDLLELWAKSRCGAHICPSHLGRWTHINLVLANNYVKTIILRIWWTYSSENEYCNSAEGTEKLSSFPNNPIFICSYNLIGILKCIKYTNLYLESHAMITISIGSCNAGVPRQQSCSTFAATPKLLPWPMASAAVPTAGTGRALCSGDGKNRKNRKTWFDWLFQWLFSIFHIFQWYSMILVQFQEDI